MFWDRRCSGHKKSMLRSINFRAVMTSMIARPFSGCAMNSLPATPMSRHPPNDFSRKFSNAKDAQESGLDKSCTGLSLKRRWLCRPAIYFKQKVFAPLPISGLNYVHPSTSRIGYRRRRPDRLACYRSFDSAKDGRSGCSITSSRTRTG